MLCSTSQQNPGLLGAGTSPKAAKRAGRALTTGVSCTFTPGHNHRASGHGKDKSPALNGHLQRVSALAMDAPALFKDEEQLRSSLSDQQARLTKMYFCTTQFELDDLEVSDWSTTGEEVYDETIAEDEDARLAELQIQTDSQQASTSSAITSSSSALIPSTRTSRRTRGRQSSRSSSNPKVRSQALYSNLERFGDLATEHLQTMGGRDEDLDFLLDIRAWLQSGRTKRRQKAPERSTIAMFLGSLGNTPLLSAKQEKHLSSIILQGSAIRAAAKELVGTLGRIPDMHEVAAAAGIASAGEVALRLALADEASDLMVQFNLRMVFAIAKKYVGKGVELADLIPEGVVGLRKAIQKFDATKGFRFSTYAHWWIRQAISRAVSDHSRVVRVPVHIVEFLLKVKKVRKELKSQPGRTSPPTYRELARALGIPVQKLVQLLRCAKEPRTPEETLGTADGGNASSGAPERADDLWVEEFEGAGDPVEESEKEEYLKSTLTLMLSTLQKRERNILRMRYGLFQNGPPLNDADASDWEDPGMNLQEVGVTYNLSRERIRQIEEKALQQLRHPWRKNMLLRVKDGEPLDEDDAVSSNVARWVGQNPPSWS